MFELIGTLSHTAFTEWKKCIETSTVGLILAYGSNAAKTHSISSYLMRNSMVFVRLTTDVTVCWALNTNY